MDQLDNLLPLSSKTPTTTTDRTRTPDTASSNPETGTSRTVCTRTPHSTYPVPTPLRRLGTIFALLLLSLWANYEASKGFDVIIINAPSRTPAGRRFNFLFVSNGRAADMVLKSSSFIEHILYPNGVFPRKHVRHVTIRLADRNITNDVVVSRHENRALVPSGEYLIEISTSVMMQKDDTKMALASALHRGMAYVWLWDGHGSAPQPMIDSLVEYLTVKYSLPLRHYESTHKTSIIAGLIQRCEERNNSFIARLNNAMLEKWDMYAVTDAFSSPADTMCLSHIILASEDGALPDVARSKLKINQAM